MHHTHPTPPGPGADRLPGGQRVSRNRPRPEHPRPERVPLMQAHPAFLQTVPQADRPSALLGPVVSRYVLPVGHWNPDDLVTDEHEPFGLIALSGALCRDTMLGANASAQLSGPGALIRTRDAISTSLPWQIQWSCIVEASVVVLDHDFPVILERWPALGELLSRQLSAQLETAMHQCALTGLSRVDDRILALFWHLADTWGTVESEGVVVQLPLTHRLIGRLVAAERATISLALGRLANRELLVRTGARTWLLHPDSQQGLTGAIDS